MSDSRVQELEEQNAKLLSEVSRLQRTLAGRQAPQAGLLPDLGSARVVCWCGISPEATRYFMDEVIRRRGAAVIGPVEFRSFQEFADADKGRGGTELYRDRSLETGLQTHLLFLFGWLEDGGEAAAFPHADAVVKVESVDASSRAAGARWRMTTGWGVVTEGALADGPM